jgi:hypothetical protein
MDLRRKVKYLKIAIGTIFALMVTLSVWSMNGCKPGAPPTHDPAPSPTQERPDTMAVPDPTDVPASTPPTPVPPMASELPSGKGPTPPKDFPDAIPSPDADSEDAAIEKSLSNLKKGNLAYSTPEKMKTGETGEVTARIGSDAVTVDALTNGLKGHDGTAVAAVSTPTSIRMKMTLKSDDFTITTLNSEEQVVSGSIPTEWKWNISANHSGKLHLHLDAIVELHGVPRDFTTIDRDISVQVDPKDEVEKFVQKNWQWILSTIAAGIALLYKFLKSKEKSGAPVAQ